MSELAETLQTYGGWGMTTVCLTVIWRLGTYIAKLHEQQRTTDAAAALAAKDDTRITVAALIETRDALHAVKEAMQTLARNLDQRRE